MNVPFSLRIESEIIQFLKSEKINVTEYINNLIEQDLKNKETNKREIERLLNKVKLNNLKKEIINQNKLIGAVKNIETRISNMAKGDEFATELLIRQNLKLLNCEFQLCQDEDIKLLILDAYTGLRVFVTNVQDLREIKTLEIAFNAQQIQHLEKQRENTLNRKAIIKAENKIFLENLPVIVDKEIEDFISN